MFHGISVEIQNRVEGEKQKFLGQISLENGDCNCFITKISPNILMLQVFLISKKMEHHSFIKSMAEREGHTSLRTQFDKCWSME